MSDQPENLILVYLRRLDSNMAALRDHVTDLRHRMTALEIQMSQHVATEANHYVNIVTRLDRIELRLERHADILPA